MNKFEKPRYEVVYFANNIISTSMCICFDGNKNWGTDDLDCNNNLSQCTCTGNTDPAQGNCIIE